MNINLIIPPHPSRIGPPHPLQCKNRRPHPAKPRLPNRSESHHIRQTHTVQIRQHPDRPHRGTHAQAGPTIPETRSIRQPEHYPPTRRLRSGWPMAPRLRLHRHQPTVNPAVRPILRPSNPPGLPTPWSCSNRQPHNRHLPKRALRSPPLRHSRSTNSPGHQPLHRQPARRMHPGLKLRNQSAGRRLFRGLRTIPGNQSINRVPSNPRFQSAPSIANSCIIAPALSK